MSKKRFLGGAVGVLLVSTAVAWLTAAPQAPTIGEVTLNPAYVVVNTPTFVLFTAHIPDPSVIINGVKVARVDSSGKQVASLGVMRDDGRSGDATAGDRVYSLRTSLTRPTVGQDSYRVVASFSSVSLLVQSNPVTLDVWHQSALGSTVRAIGYPPNWALFYPEGDSAPDRIVVTVTPTAREDSHPGNGVTIRTIPLDDPSQTFDFDQSLQLVSTTTSVINGAVWTYYFHSDATGMSYRTALTRVANVQVIVSSLGQAVSGPMFDSIIHSMIF